MPIFTIVLKEHFSMKRTSYILIWLLLLVLSSCTVLETRRTLNTIEGLVHNYPDSAWSKVNEINNADLKTKHLQAYYALLYSVAADKTYHDFTSDSIARIAVNYYDTKGSDRHRMLAWYSLGRVQINAEQWTSAIISLTEAKESAEIIKDIHYLGLIYKHLAGVYHNNYDNAHAIEYADKAIDFFTNTKENRYIPYIEYSRIVYYIGDRRLHEADSLMEKALSDTSFPSNLRTKVLLLMARRSVLSEDYRSDTILDSYNTLSGISRLLTAHDYANIAYGYSLKYERDSVRYYLQRAHSLSMEESQKAKVAAVESRIAEKLNDPKRSLECLNSAVQYEDSLLHEKLNNSVAYSLTSYQEQRLKQEKIQYDNQRLIMMLIVLSSTCVIGLLLSLYRRNRRALQNALGRAAELSDNLSFAERSRNRLQTLVVNQYRDKLRNLKNLSNSYLFWETNNFKKERRKGEFATEGEILERFRAQLHELRKDREMLVMLEEETDACNNHLISQLRREAANLSEKGKRLDETDYLLLVLFLSGFDNHHVAFLSGLDYDLVRKRKSRLFAKLENLGIPAATALLALVTKK